MSHEDTLMIVSAIHAVAWAVLTVAAVLATGILVRAMWGTRL